ncbi:MAG TPA: MmcQ/YjbR family DNA-binding protein [Actinomycetota bacterium]
MRSLPEAEERETWGHPTFRVRDKLFAAMSDDGQQASVKATKQEQTALVSAAPETFGIPADVGRHGWVSIQSATVDPADGERGLGPLAWPRGGSGDGGRGSMRAWLLDLGRFR